MKRTYKLLGYLLLGIGAYAFLNANNTDLYAQRYHKGIIYPLGQANSPVTEQQTTYKRNRHTITLVLSQLSDLKAEEGQRVNVGDIISDRTIEKTKLLAKKERLTTAIA
ncbi:MAG: hypothetical protein WBM44_20570 [Waterburya sp.]